MAGPGDGAETSESRAAKRKKAGREGKRADKTFFFRFAEKRTLVNTLELLAAAMKQLQRRGRPCRGRRPPHSPASQRARRAAGPWPGREPNPSHAGSTAVGLCVLYLPSGGPLSEAGLLRAPCLPGAESASDPHRICIGSAPHQIRAWGRTAEALSTRNPEPATRNPEFAPPQVQTAGSGLRGRAPQPQRRADAAAGAPCSAPGSVKIILS